MTLTDIKVKTAKSADKDYKLSDGKGLFLLVKKSGSKYWRMKYRIDGREKLLAIGVYPDTSLASARKACNTAREQLTQGIDPSQHKQASKAARKNAVANNFEAVAREWLTRRGKKSESGDKRLLNMLEKDLFPHLGKGPIGDITPPELLRALRRIEGRGAIETAHRAKQYAGQIFRYAVATGRCDRDPSADLTGALKVPIKSHFPAITNPREVGALMVAIHDYQGTPPVKAALKLSPLLFCRPGELRQMEWPEVNFGEKRVELPAEKMKIKEPHIIPLSTQALSILEELYLLTGRGRYVFPSARGASRPLSENGVRTALRSLGYTNEQMSPHGFRAMARTLLDEVLEFPVDWIEHQLAHAVRDANGRAYNRTKHLKQRREMMQRWADYLDELRMQTASGVVIGSFGEGQQNGPQELENLPFLTRLEHKMRNPTKYDESGSGVNSISLQIQQEAHAKARGEQKSREGEETSQKVIKKIIELLMRDTEWSSSIDKLLDQPELLKNDAVWRSLTGQISSIPDMPCQDHVRRIRDANMEYILREVKNKTTQAG